MRKTYNFLLLLFVFISFNGLNAQSITKNAVTITPYPFTVNDEITIDVDLTKGCKAKGDITTASKIYLHSGVGSETNAWINTTGNWGKDDGVGLMTKNTDNTWSITFTPKDYYKIEDGEESDFVKMGMVFRSQDGSSEMKDPDNSCEDYFFGVGNFQITLVSPEVADGGMLVMNSGETLNIHVTSSETANFSIKESGTEVSTATNVSEIQFSKQITETNTYSIEVDNGSSVKSIGFSVIIEATPIVEELPAGMRDGINYHSDDDTKATLVLQAPNKTYVYVKGDFSDWGIQGKNLLKRTSANITDENIRYWITLEGLESGVEYGFQYVVDGSIVIPDPYTEKTLDEHDGGIPDEVYPNLKPYPKGMTEGIVSIIQTGQEEYNWQSNDFVKPAKENLIIYELLVRDFVHKHSYQSILDTMDYLERMNITAIELMPINEFDNNESWGYNPTFYFAPDKYYGPKNKLKELIDEAHKRGIAVIIDLVLNHSEGLSPFLQLYMNNYVPTDENLWYTDKRSIPEATWGIDFDHQSVHTQALVDSVNSFWMNEYHVDGFRFDFTKGFTNTQHPSGSWGGAYDAQRIGILKRMSDEIWKRSNDAYVIFEHLGGNQEEKELADYGIMLWGNMTGSYQSVSKGYDSNLNWASHLDRGWSQPNLVAYSSSHDEERIAYENKINGRISGRYNIKEHPTSMERMQLQALFLWTIPGPKMIWQFDEVGYDISIDDPCRVCNKPILWNYTKDADRIRVYNLHKAIMKLKKTETTFSTTNFTLDLNSGLSKSIILDGDDMDVVLAGNFDVINQSVVVNFTQTGTWYDYFTGEEYEVSTTSQSIALAPGKYKLYTTKQLDTPNLDESISLSIDEIAYDKNTSINPLSIYPIPVRGNATIKYSISERSPVTIEIFNLQGQVVEKYKYENQAKGTHTANWQVNGNQKEGIYFIRISTAIESFTRKITVE
jgi:1,4-alpha-glucan branching enzyme